ncbi:MAG: hypothetical protein ACREV4_01230 [Gammaproteobacteria bacterium]
MSIIPREVQIALLAISALFTASAEARIKCWTNDEGLRECGNAVPPEYAQKEHRVLSEDGVVIEKQKRAKTESEIQEEQNRVREKAEQERLAREQAERDRVLQETFASEDDLKMAMDGKLSTITSQIKLRASHIENLEANLNDLVSVAGDMERRGEKPNAKVLQDIDNVRRQMQESESFIKAQHTEQESLKQKFAADLKRLRELRGQEP